MPLTDNTPNPNILSLFDGMSCGQIALRGLGVSCGKYYASEIDKHAIAQTQLNFPDTVQLGDVTRWREWSIDWASIDLLLAGSPCQGFSFAGKQLAFDDPRSQLFFVFIDILNHIRTFNPNVKFLLENVNMKRSHMAVINQYCGLFPVNINSALVSAQNRDRWYWSNIRTRQQGLFAEVHTDIPQPPDRGIFLKDILQSDVDRKYYLKKDTLNKLLAHKERHKQAGNGFGAVFHKDTDKMATVRVGGRNIDDLVCVAMRGRANGQQLEPNHTQKTNCLTSVQKDNLIVQNSAISQRERGNNKGGLFINKTPTMSANSWEQNNLVIQITPSKESGGKQPYQGNRIYSDAGKYVALQTELRGSVAISGTLRTHKDGYGFRVVKSGKAACIPARAREDGSGQNVCKIDNVIRRLTPTECSRLQTVPESYVWKCSETQAYKMLGNGWTILVIMWILSFSRWVTDEQRTEFNNKYFNQ